MPKGKRTRIKPISYYQAEIVRQERGKVIVEATSLAEARELALELSECKMIKDKVHTTATIVKINKIKR